MNKNLRDIVELCLKENISVDKLIEESKILIKWTNKFILYFLMKIWDNKIQIYKILMETH